MTPRTASALAATFVANGLAVPSFLARLAERQADLGLTDAQLGSTVLGTGLGALAASPLAGWAIGRIGSRAVTAIAGVALGATLWASAVAPSAPALFGALALIGAADAAMDIGMNANGTAHEARGDRSALHRLHAAWSLGALAAAGLGTLAASGGLGLGPHLGLVGAAIVATALLARPGLVDRDVVVDRAGGPAAPRRAARLAVLTLGAATVAAAVLEGTMGDWSAINAERLGLSVGLAPLGTAAFMGGMLVGRLLGDRRTDRHGGTLVLRRGMVLCAAGLLVGVASADPVVFLVGVAAAGAGVSVFFPLAFSSASRLAGGAGTAAVSLGARVGFLAEPVLVGAVAEASELRVAFGLGVVVAAGLALVAGRLAP